MATTSSKHSVGYCFKIKHRRHDEGHTLKLTSDTAYKEEVEKSEYKIIPCRGTQMELTTKSDKEESRRIKHIQLILTRL
jgi:hypothetical protein